MIADEDVDQIVRILADTASVRSEFGREMRGIKLLGGAFGGGSYGLYSWLITGRGLHKLKYLVVHEPTDVMVGIGDSKAEALAAARTILTAAQPVLWQVVLGRVAEALEQSRKAERERRDEAAAVFFAARGRRGAGVRSIPRRRRQVFEKCGGKCHYCSTELQLEGKWHIDHKMPRALLGSNEPSNLVASCAPCNLKKRDTTDVEFMQGRAA
jgi:hypothetical protein